MNYLSYQIKNNSRFELTKLNSFEFVLEASKQASKQAER